MTGRPPAPDVVIVGGGVIGCATAYFLATEHRQRCLIIERDAIGSAASGGAAGELAAVELATGGGGPHDETYTRFLQEGIALHASLAPALLEESGIDYLLTNLRMLRPAFDEAEAAALRAQLDSGVGGEWLDAESLGAMDSWLAANAIGAAYSLEMQLEAYPFTIALAQAAEQHGVEIRTGEVTGLEAANGRVTGVRVGAETIEAGKVLIANGPWAVHAAGWGGIELPLIPLRGQIVHLALPAGQRAPGQAIFHESGYLLPKTGGDLMAGTTIEDAGFDIEPTNEAKEGILEAVVRLAPKALEVPIKNITACLRPYAADGRPIIGMVLGQDGLFIATGHGFKGITLALVTGKNLAQVISRGSSDFLLDSFSPARFVQGA